MTRDAEVLEIQAIVRASLSQGSDVIDLLPRCDMTRGDADAAQRLLLNHLLPNSAVSGVIAQLEADLRRCGR